MQMKKHSNEQRMLWLSDIHLDASKLTNKFDVLSYNKYFESFISFLKKEYPQPNDINYIIISGDLVQSGDMKSYEAFKIHILKPLLEFYKDCLVITCPGNHDVNWSKVNEGFVEKYIKSYVEKNHSRIKDTANDKQFLHLFEDYTNFLTNFPENNGSINKYFDNFLPSYLTVSNNYREYRLNGVIVDTKKKMLFCILNSAWVSLGSTFHERSIKKFSSLIEKNDFDKEKLKEEFRKAIDEVSAIQEYGQQTIHEELFKNHLVSDGSDLKREEDEIVSRFLNDSNTDFSDYLFINIIHHPSSWIRENERINFKTPKNTKDLLLNKVRGKCDILLTGHEHLPYTHPVNPMHDGTIHFEAGKFTNIDELGEDGNNFKGNRFSVLTVNLVTENNHSPFLYEHRYSTFLKDPDDAESYEWRKEDEYSERFELKKFANRKTSPKII